MLLKKMLTNTLQVARWNFIFFDLGYVLGIDLTARDLQEEAKKKGLPWSAAKGFDTFNPVSQFIPKGSFDHNNANIWLKVWCWFPEIIIRWMVYSSKTVIRKICCLSCRD